MISKINNSNPSFNGIVPVRVFVDGQQVVNNPQALRSATRKLTSALINPAENREIADTFARFDPTYKIAGYPRDTKPSDFFKLVMDKYRGNFLATGPQTERLNELGKDIGVEKALCKERGTTNSLDLIVAKKKYGSALSDMLSSAKLRFCEITDKWRPVTLNINIQGEKLQNIFFTT